MEREFENDFEFLTGNKPFPWQTRLFQRFILGEFPQTSLPTGLGKTSVITIWLLALAKMPDAVPRRLIYVVNRRTVVDQATEEAKNLREKAKAHPNLRERLTSLTSKPHETPLAISTLRGQFADNQEWREDPARPAIIVGTVDMVGSRLLFHGYGIGFKAKPLHAGFLGQDSLLVHDESHLEPAFQTLLETIEKEQIHSSDWKPMKVMELTATPRSTHHTFTLDESDLRNSYVQKRIQAPKHLKLHPISDEKKDLVPKILEIARSFQEFKQAILIYARNVDSVLAIAEGLNKADQNVEVLTGTMRGWERDKLTAPPEKGGSTIFQRFLPSHNGSEQDPQTVYLVSTSAGEVGINLSSDQMICDLVPFDSMAQRFGRVNRFGLNDQSTIHVIHPVFEEPNDPYEIARAKTLNLLGDLDQSANPHALGRLPGEKRIEAFSPGPKILRASDILFDAWAMTSVLKDGQNRADLPGRPPLAPYLHGISPEIPETKVAWRQEVAAIQGEFLNEFPPESLLEEYPVKNHEILKDRSDRIFATLKKIPHAGETPVWLVDDSGVVQVTKIESILDEGKERIEAKLLLLPGGVGSLNRGLFTHEGEPANDVAEEIEDDKGPQRIRKWNDSNRPKGMRLVQIVNLTPSQEETSDEEPEPRIWYWFVRNPESPDAKSTREYPLEAHLADAGQCAQSLAKALKLPPDLETALIQAAHWHDLGKHRKTWQSNLGNPDYPHQVWAKSGKPNAARLQTPYRHEFGSLFDAQSQEQWNALTDFQRDLVLHFIASHHGRARPHFPSHEVFDFQPNQGMAELADSVPLRFARLQKRFGRWGLAYLESLLRAADILASKMAEEVAL